MAVLPESLYRVLNRITKNGVDLFNIFGTLVPNILTISYYYYITACKLLQIQT